MSTKIIPLPPKDNVFQCRHCGNPLAIIEDEICEGDTEDNYTEGLFACPVCHKNIMVTKKTTVSYITS